MKEIGLGEYKSFLRFVIDRVEDLKDIEIQIANGEQFSATKVFDFYAIDTLPKLDDSLDLMTTKYFEDKINQNVYWFVNRFNEFFVLLHEIGHIVTRKLYDDNQMKQQYSSFKARIKDYNTKYDAYKSYRNLPIEKLADGFAIEFTNKYFYEIVNYFTGMSKEEIDNGVNLFKF